MKKIVNYLLIISFGIYILLFIWIIYLKANVSSWINATYNLFKGMSIKERFLYDLIPFKDNGIVRVRSNIYNVIIFFPLPIYLKVIFPKIKNYGVLLISLFITMLIETSQLFIPFCGFATEDIICNFIGSILGLVLFNIFLDKKSLYENKLMLISYMLFALPMFIYALVNTMINLSLYKI